MEEEPEDDEGGESKNKTNKPINTTINPFDNKVIIIDEAHNFVSRIVNKLKTKKNTFYTFVTIILLVLIIVELYF